MDYQSKSYKSSLILIAGLKAGFKLEVMNKFKDYLISDKCEDHCMIFLTVIVLTIIIVVIIDVLT